MKKSTIGALALIGTQFIPQVREVEKNLAIKAIEKFGRSAIPNMINETVFQGAHLDSAYFTNAEPMLYDNGNKTDVYSNYLNSNIPKNLNNWELYESQVLKDNPNSLSGVIILRNFDRDKNNIPG